MTDSGIQLDRPAREYRTGGQPVEVTGADNQYADQYRSAVEQLAEDQQPLAFKNVIRNEGSCGFANGGSTQHLLNTDPGGRYRVTVRTHWRSGIENGQSDQIYISEAGGKQMLGCSDSGYIPVTYYVRQIVGEVRL